MGGRGAGVSGGGDEAGAVEGAGVVVDGGAGFHVAMFFFWLMPISFFI